ncbi:transcription factor with AP2 domain(s), putative [Plasmodium ovale]|uniref:Transcription factor with AP2 domain(S), putative n=2 Tax=Plasmodium ovale TaxID=36330 RepID=A0A1D3TII8_PLAOA|nr:transcription factor with AP2 domain(s), putative (AP2-O) [Plasmodium ovale curtisi]SBS92090.1 transcription factor with AP2 domain(s), putative (AP2-O) [Plasmodium ovale curtisi]SCP04756.1 transcription factor with AP2 domain(s), putative [Plasmodium ovale]
MNDLVNVNIVEENENDKVIHSNEEEKINHISSDSSPNLYIHTNVRNINSISNKDEPIYHHDSVNTSNNTENVYEKMHCRDDKSLHISINNITENTQKEKCPHQNEKSEINKKMNNIASSRINESHDFLISSRNTYENGDDNGYNNRSGSNNGHNEGDNNSNDNSRGNVYQPGISDTNAVINANTSNSYNCIDRIDGISHSAYSVINTRGGIMGEAKENSPDKSLTNGERGRSNSYRGDYWINDNRLSASYPLDYDQPRENAATSNAKEEEGCSAKDKEKVFNNYAFGDVHKNANYIVEGENRSTNCKISIPSRNSSRNDNYSNDVNSSDLTKNTKKNIFHNFLPKCDINLWKSSYKSDIIEEQGMNEVKNDHAYDNGYGAVELKNAPTMSAQGGEIKKAQEDCNFSEKSNAESKNFYGTLAYKGKGDVLNCTDGDNRVVGCSFGNGSPIKDDSHFCSSSTKARNRSEEERSHGDAKIVIAPAHHVNDIFKDSNAQVCNNSIDFNTNDKNAPGFDDRKSDMHMADDRKSDMHMADGRKSDMHMADDRKSDMHMADDRKSDKHMADDRKNDMHISDDSKKTTNYMHKVNAPSTIKNTHDIAIINEKDIIEKGVENDMSNISAYDDEKYACTSSIKNYDLNDAENDSFRDSRNSEEVLVKKEKIQKDTQEGQKEKLKRKNEECSSTYNLNNSCTYNDISIFEKTQNNSEHFPKSLIFNLSSSSLIKDTNCSNFVNKDHMSEVHSASKEHSLNHKKNLSPFATNNNNTIEGLTSPNIVLENPVEFFKENIHSSEKMDMHNLSVNIDGKEENGIFPVCNSESHIDDGTHKGICTSRLTNVDGITSVSGDSGVSSVGYVNNEHVAKYGDDESIRKDDMQNNEVENLNNGLIRKKVREDTIIDDINNGSSGMINSEGFGRKVSDETIINDMIDENVVNDMNQNIMLKKLSDDTIISGIHSMHEEGILKKMSEDTIVSGMHSTHTGGEEGKGRVTKEVVMSKMSEQEIYSDLKGIVDQGNSASNQQEMCKRSTVKTINRQHTIRKTNNRNRCDSTKGENVLINQKNETINKIPDLSSKFVSNDVTIGGGNYSNNVDSGGSVCGNDSVSGKSGSGKGRSVEGHVGGMGVDYTNEKYMQWFETIYTVCTKLDDLCCKLSSEFPHSMNLWENSGKLNMRSLKSVFHKNDITKCCISSGEKNKSRVSNLSTTERGYCSGYCGDCDGNSGKYVPPGTANLNEGKEKHLSSYRMNNALNGGNYTNDRNLYPTKESYSQNVVDSYVSSHNIGSAECCGERCGECFKGEERKNENGTSTKIMNDYILNGEETYNHKTNSMQEGNYGNYVKGKKNLTKMNHNGLHNVVTKDALEILNLYNNGSYNKLKNEQFHQTSQYNGIFDTGRNMSLSHTKNMNHVDCNTGSTTNKGGIITTLSGHSANSALLGYTDDSNINDEILNGGTDTKRKKGSKKNLGISKNGEKKTNKKVNTVSRNTNKIVKNESEFEYLLDLSDKEGPNMENPEDLRCDVAGVYWDKRSWIASWYDNGKRYYKSFSAKTHGFYKSKFWAIKVRLSKVKGQTIFGKNGRKGKANCASADNNLSFNNPIVNENNNFTLSNA